MTNEPNDLPPLHGKHTILALLEQYGLHPTKRRGQNFVIDPNTVSKIVADARVQPGDHVVEVGPGLGSLTLALLHAQSHVTAVELDHGLAKAVEEICASDKLTVVTADAVTINWEETLRDVQQTHPELAGKPVAMVANLPYNVATPILMEAVKSRQFSRFDVMVQKEVGQRWMATSGKDLGAISIKLALFADVAITTAISRQAFHPIPNVDSVMVAVIPRELQDREGNTVSFETCLQAADLIDRGFSQRRKLVRNAMASPQEPPAAIDEYLEACGLPLAIRAEQIEPLDWVALAQARARAIDDDAS